MLEQAERICQELTDRGVDVLYDDRDVSPGVKFADADLVGVPVQIVVGAKGLAKGIVERKGYLRPPVRATTFRSPTIVSRSGS